MKTFWSHWTSFTVNHNSPANSVCSGEVVVVCGVPGWSPTPETIFFFFFYRLLSLIKTTNEKFMFFKLSWLIRLFIQNFTIILHSNTQHPFNFTASILHKHIFKLLYMFICLCITSYIKRKHQERRKHQSLHVHTDTWEWVYVSKTVFHIEGIGMRKRIKNQHIMIRLKMHSVVTLCTAEGVITFVI